jgi:hypothetical protein
MLLTFGNSVQAQLEMRQRPDCEATLDATGGGTDGQSFDNRTSACVVWYFSYFSNGFSALSVTVQAAPDSNGQPGTFASWTAARSFGALPMTTLTNQGTTLVGFEPWVRLRLNSATGTGRLIGRIYGYKGQVPSNYIESGIPGVVVPALVRQVQAFGEGTEISTLANTAVKATAGILNHVTVNLGAAGTIELWDATSANCTATPTGTRRGIITTVAGTLETLTYNMRMANGICVRTVTAVGNITVGFN